MSTENITKATVLVCPAKANAPKLKICAELDDPEARKYADIPNLVNMDIYLDDGKDTYLAEILAEDMTCGIYGEDAVGIMDSHSYDWYIVGNKLFEQSKRYPVGNVVLLNFQNTKGPSDEMFAEDFDMNALVDGILAACDVLMIHPRRKADYFVFLGNPSVWAPDAKWKKAFKECGYDIRSGDSRQNFVAIRKAKPVTAKITIAETH